VAKLIFASKASSDSAYQAHDPEDLINFLVEVDQDKAKLRPVAGEELHVDTGQPLLAEMKQVNQSLWCVSNGTFFRIDRLGSAAPLGTVIHDDNTTISGNLDMTLVSAEGQLWAWDGASFDRVDLTGARFEDVGAVGFLGNYSIITEREGNQFQWSELADGKSWPALNFARAEADADKIIAIESVNKILVIFGGSTIELWAPSGAADENAFAPLPGGVIEVGLLGPKLHAKTDVGIFFIGDDKVPYVLSGAQVAPLMDGGVQSDIEAETPDRVFYCEDRGHKLGVIRFKGRPARMYDFTQRRWLKRATGDGAWAAVSAAQAYGEWFTGRNTGQISKMARNGKDFDQPLIRQATSRRVEFGRDRFVIRALEFFGDFGDEAADIWMETSKDCRKYENERIEVASVVGEQERRLIFRNLGMFRQMSARIRMTDPVDMAIDAVAHVEVA